MNTLANNKHLRVKNEDIPYLIEHIRFNLFEKEGDINKIVELLKISIDINDLEIS